MYFASDRCNTGAVSKALGEMIRESPERNWLALVDGAFDHGLVDLALPNERHALYDFGNVTDLLGASPFLITLTVDDDVRLQFELTSLLRHRRERPMLSFIGSTSPASSVNENFRLYANALTDDKQEFLLRFADTRVLDGLPGALRQEYWDGMTCLMSEWVLIDRKGELRQLPLRVGRMPLEGAFQLSSAEFDCLLLNSEPDAIVDTIADSNPEAVPETKRVMLYGMVAEACAFAKTNEVRAFPDLVALAYVGVLTGGKGLRDPKLRELLLGGQWKSGSLIDRLMDFVE